MRKQIREAEKLSSFSSQWPQAGPPILQLAWAASLSSLSTVSLGRYITERNQIKIYCKIKGTGDQSKLQGTTVH